MGGGGEGCSGEGEEGEAVMGGGNVASEIRARLVEWLRFGTVPEAYAWTRTICIAWDCILRGVDAICVEWT